MKREMTSLKYYLTDQKIICDVKFLSKHLQQCIAIFQVKVDPGNHGLQNALIVFALYLVVQTFSFKVLILPFLVETKTIYTLSC